MNENRTGCVMFYDNRNTKKIRCERADVAPSGDKIIVRWLKDADTNGYDRMKVLHNEIIGYFVAGYSGDKADMKHILKKWLRERIDSLKNQLFEAEIMMEAVEKVSYKDIRTLHLVLEGYVKTKADDDDDDDYDFVSKIAGFRIHHISANIDAAENVVEKLNANYSRGVGSDVKLISIPNCGDLGEGLSTWKIDAIYPQKLHSKTIMTPRPYLLDSAELSRTAFLVVERKITQEYCPENNVERSSGYFKILFAGSDRREATTYFSRMKGKYRREEIKESFGYWERFNEDILRDSFCLEERESKTTEEGTVKCIHKSETAFLEIPFGDNTLSITTFEVYEDYEPDVSRSQYFDEAINRS